jgi:hypothetical protein
MSQGLRPGDPVIYRLTKTSVHPGPRAKGVYPAPHGDNYTYNVDKFWRVKEIKESGELLLYTRRGKEHLCEPNDANLRKPGFLTWLIYRQRFPRPEGARGEDASQRPSNG